VFYTNNYYGEYFDIVCNRVRRINQGRVIVLHRRFVITAVFFSLFMASDELVLASQASDAPILLEQIPTLKNYDEESYQLAYDIYAAAKQPKKALKVAQAGMAEAPESIDWQRRTASIAAWAGEPQLAMHTWFDLYKQTNESGALNETIRLAKVHYDDAVLLEALNLKLEQEPYDLSMRLDWVRAMEREGRAEEAELTLEELLKSSQKSHEKFYLQELARLYERSGDVTKEISTLSEMTEKYESNAQMSLRQAAIYFNEGDIVTAKKLLSDASDDMLETDVEYWSTLASLSWLVEDKEVALKAYKILYSTDNMSDADIRNMLGIMFEEQPKEAFELGVYAMKTSEDPLLFAELVDMAQVLNEWPVMVQLLQKFTPKQRETLEKNKLFWQLQPYVLQNAGEDVLAIKLYQEALNKYPGDQGIRTNYLWMLVLSKNNELLEKEVRKLSTDEQKSVELEKAYAYSALQLGYSKLAVQSYQKQVKEEQDDVSLYLTYAEALDKSDMSELARKVRAYVWKVVQKTKSSLTEEDVEQILTLARNNGQIDAALPMLAHLLNEKRSLEAVDALVFWGLSNQEYPLLRYLKNNLYSTSTFPGYAAMVLALIDNDRPELEEQLSSNLKNHPLPNSDDVLAAEALGNLEMARAIAFQQAEAHPDRELDQRELRRLLMLTANVLTFKQEYERVQSLQGPVTTLQSYWFLNNHWQSDLTMSRWGITKKNDDTFERTPADDSYIQARMEYLINPGYSARQSYWQGTVGFRSAWQEFYFAKLQTSYATSDRTRWTTALGYNQRATETVPLRVAGTKDNLVLTNTYLYSPRNLLTSSVAAEAFHNQSRDYLGMGASASFSWQYLWRVTYPDVIIAPSITGNWYRPNGSIAAVDVPLIARTPGTPPNTDVSFFMPSSQVTFGASLNIGTSHQTLFNTTGSLIDPQQVSYKRRWRPYFTTSLFHTVSQISTATTLGFTGGVAGSLFGHDNLSLYFNYSMGQGGAGLASYLVGLQYKYYY